MVSKAFARLHRWHLAASVLSCTALAQLDRDSRGRLRYALTLLAQKDPARARMLLHRVLQKNIGPGPEVCLELAAMATCIGSASQAHNLLLQAARDPSQPITADVAHRLLRVQRGLEDGSLDAELRDAIEDLSLPYGIVTLVPVSEKYLALWTLWLGQVRRHVGGSVVAMAMDDRSLETLSPEPGVSVVDVRRHFSWSAKGALHPQTRGVLWLLRVMLLRTLVRTGHTALVLDLDAMPVGNVQILLRSLITADVVAQRDASIPMEVFRRFGFILCCGFMAWRPTAGTHLLLDRFVEQTARERDDQLALNHLLAAGGISSANEENGTLQFRSAGVSFACPPVAQVSRSLAAGSVVRHFHQTGQTVAGIRSALSLES